MEEDLPQIEYCHPSTARADAKRRFRRLCRRCATGALLTLAALCAIVGVAVAAWQWVYGNARALSNKEGQVQLRAILGPLEAKAQVRASARLRRFDDPDTYYYRLSVEPSRADEFVKEILSAWNRQAGTQIATGTSASVSGFWPSWWGSWQGDSVACYELTQAGGPVVYYRIVQCTPRGEIWILENRFGSASPIIPMPAQSTARKTE